MDFNEIARRRYSVRKYLPDPVSDEDLAYILEAAELAPTAHNNQPFRLFILRVPGHEEDLQKIYDRHWFVQPPLVLGICIDNDLVWRRTVYDNRNYGLVDAGIVMDHIIMAATSRGLGTCWVANFNPDAAREVLNLPPNLEPVIFTPLGFPADEMREKRRRPIELQVVYDRYEE